MTRALLFGDCRLKKQGLKFNSDGLKLAVLLNFVFMVVQHLEALFLKWT